MKMKHLYQRHAFGAVIATAFVAMTLASCAVDGYDDETFSGGVTGQTLSSPAADSIVFTANADGTKTTISWPVVYGAGGYRCSVLNVSDESHPVVVVADTVVDGTTLVVPRTEDVNYSFSIRTVGNEELGNSDAAETTTAFFSSYLPGYATIPDGSDIAEWLSQNALPDDKGEVALDLVENGHYTLNANATFGNAPVTIRTTSSNRATITVGADASFVIKGGFSLKNVVIDGSNCSNPLILMNAEPNPATKNTVSDKGFYYIEDPVKIVNCLVSNLTDEVINNNKTQYCIHTFLVDNSVFHFNTASGHGSGSYFNMYNNGACINDFSASNSTFYNTSDNEMKYFLRYNNSGGPKRTGYSKATVTLRQCTFYNIVKKSQICNYDGLRRTDLATFTLDHNIIADTGNKQFVRRFIAGGSWSDAGIKNFTSNTYVMDGEDAWTMPDAADPTTWTGEAQYDQTGTIVAGNPGFKDAVNGDFTVSGANQIASRNGDPRWLPSAQ